MRRELVRSLLVAATLVLVVAAVYRPVARYEYLTLDDNSYVSANHEVLRGLTLRGLAWSLTTFHASNWHPLTWLSHMADVQIFGPGPAGPHVVNVLLHTANALLLWRVLLALTGQSLAAAAVAVLFALHPLRVESVAWVAERKDVLCGFFWLLTLAAWVRYLRSPAPRRYLLVVGSFLCALLAKPMAVTLPLVLLILDYWPFGRLLQGGDRRRTVGRLLLEKSPLFALSAAAAAVTVVAQSRGLSIPDLMEYSLGTRLANAAVSLASYLGKTIWPSDLSVFYPLHGPPGPGATIGACLLLVLISVIVARERRRRPWLTVSWLWYLTTLLPVIGLVQVGHQSRADRYLYLPGIGLLLGLVWAVGALGARRPRARAFAALAFLVVCGAWGTVAARQVGFWRDTGVLMERALSVTEGNWIAHTSLGNLALREGRVEDARRHYLAAISLRPGFVEPRNNLGALLAGEGRLLEAVAQYREALEIQPAQTMILFNLGIALARLGRVDEAFDAYRRAADTGPADFRVFNNLGGIQLQRGDLPGAAASFREAVDANPSSVEGRLNLAIVLERMGDRAAARQAYREVLRDRPDDLNAQRALSRLGI